MEIASPIARTAIEAARIAGKLAIASFHDFERTPDARSLAGRVEAGRALGADVVKIAAQVRGAADLRTLARVLVERDDAGPGLIVIGMGDAGVASRVLFPALGSLLTYASAGTQTAPGQLALDEAVALLRRLRSLVLLPDAAHEVGAGAGRGRRDLDDALGHVVVLEAQRARHDRVHLVERGDVGQLEDLLVGELRRAGASKVASCTRPFWSTSSSM